jgi:hypothetical protein
MDWPPIKEGMCFDLIWIVGKDAAALAQNLVEIIERLEVFIRDGLVGQRTQMFGRLDLRRIGRRNINSIPSGTLILGDMPARPFED